MELIDLVDYYHAPLICKECEGVMVYKGVGEYHCVLCGHVDFDDYGKVRGYLEEHKGATAIDIEQATGVSQRSIRKMLRDSRIEVAENSKTFLRCEICGKDIRSGRFCLECEIKAHRKLEEQQRDMLRKDVKGYGKDETGDTGHKRFVRDED